MSLIIKLNVGGVHYETTWVTLMRDPESMLAKMIDQENEKGKIKNGQELFIDRDGPAFNYVLNYLRNGDQAALPATDKEKMQVLLQEADFYQLRGLINLIKQDGFQVGNLVGITASGAEYLNLIIARILRGECTVLALCWVCQNQFKFEFPEIQRDKSVYAMPYRMKNPAITLGRVLELRNDCAIVGFAYSNLKNSYGYNQPMDDTMVNLHLPLKYLEKK